MSSDNQYTALGPAAIGFQTDGANIDFGAGVQGRICGAQAASMADQPSLHNLTRGTGVLGVGDSTGILGFSGDAVQFADGDVGGVPLVDSLKDFGVVGCASLKAGVLGATMGGGIGVLGRADTGVMGDASGREGGIGVYARAGNGGGTGVIAEGGFDNGTGVWGFVNSGGDPGIGVVGTAADKPFGKGVLGSDAPGVPLMSTYPVGVYAATESTPARPGVGLAAVVAFEDPSLNSPDKIAANAVAVYGQAGLYFDRERGGTLNAKGFAGVFVGPVAVIGDFFVLGIKGAAIRAPDGTHRAVYCVESPESLLEDFGEAKLSKGRATVAFDRTFAPLIAQKGYRVFVTANGPCQGLYVSRRGPRSFEVREQGGGKSNVSFCYRIVGKRKDVTAPRLGKVAVPPLLNPARAKRQRAAQPRRLPPRPSADPSGYVTNARRR